MVHDDKQAMMMWLCLEMGYTGIPVPDSSHSKGKIMMDTLGLGPRGFPQFSDKPRSVNRHVRWFHRHFRWLHHHFHGLHHHFLRSHSGWWFQAL